MSSPHEHDPGSPYPDATGHPGGATPAEGSAASQAHDYYQSLATQATQNKHWGTWPDRKDPSPSMSPGSPGPFSYVEKPRGSWQGVTSTTSPRSWMPSNSFDLYGAGAGAGPGEQTGYGWPSASAVVNNSGERSATDRGSGDSFSSGSSVPSSVWAQQGSGPSGDESSGKEDDDEKKKTKKPKGKSSKEDEGKKAAKPGSSRHRSHKKPHSSQRTQDFAEDQNRVRPDDWDTEQQHRQIYADVRDTFHRAFPPQPGS